MAINAEKEQQSGVSYTAKRKWYITVNWTNCIICSMGQITRYIYILEYYEGESRFMQLNNSTSSYRT